MSFCTESFIKKMGSRVVPVGTWNGSLNTVSGLQSVSAPIYIIMLKDKTNHFHQIKAIQIPSIGTTNKLDDTDFFSNMQNVEN